MKRLLTPSLLLAAVAMVSHAEFYLGADISGTSELEARGVTLYNADGQPRENTLLMKELGLNAVRLRVWVNPRDGFCAPQDVAMMARRARDLNLPVMIDFHYSDWWADPGKQNIPKQWEQMDYAQMCRALAEHTRTTLQLLRDNQIDVRWVQIGNETTNGFLWPMGQADINMEQYAGLTKAGCEAAKQVYPDADVIIHLDAGCDPKRYDFIFDGLRTYGVTWDIIGMSIYPYWDIDAKLESDYHGTINDFTANVRRLADKYHTELMIVETGVEAKMPHIGKQILAEIINAAINRCNGHCHGVFYWAPEAEGHYPLGAFNNHRPTAIMDAFTEAAQADVLKAVKQIYSDVSEAYNRDNLTDNTVQDVDFSEKFCSTRWNQAVDRIQQIDADIEGIGFFDSDYWVMGQDVENFATDNYRVVSLSPTPTVEFDLHNCGNIIRVSVQLAKENGVWKIDNFIDLSLDFDWKQAMRNYIEEN